MTVAPIRLPAAERRLALIETAIRVFSDGSYRGTTTAEIAREAGISEPILYRHFASKRDLYFAALEHVWSKARAEWEGVLASTADVREGFEAMGRGHVTIRDCKFQMSELWVQALSEANEDPVIAEALHAQIREVHDWFAGLIREGQAEGQIVADRDPVAEAWILLGGGLLATINGRLGGFLGDDLQRVQRERTRWMTGRN